MELSSELLFILKSKETPPCVGRKPKATEEMQIHVQEEGTTGELYRGKDAWASNAWTKQRVVSNASPAYWELAEGSGYMYSVLLLHTVSAKS